MVNQKIRRSPITEEKPKPKEYGDIWGSPSDGKYYKKNVDDEWMRK